MKKIQETFRPQESDAIIIAGAESESARVDPARITDGFLLLMLQVDMFYLDYFRGKTDRLVVDTTRIWSQ
jgi:hypothetical protein